MIDANTTVMRRGNNSIPFSRAGALPALRSKTQNVRRRGWDVPSEQVWASHLPLLPLLHGMGRLRPLTALLGIDKDENPLMLDLGRPGSWHMVLEGSGSSNILRAAAAAMALSTRQSQLQYIGIDPSGQDLLFLESIPHTLAELVRDELFTEEMLRWLVDEMGSRRRLRIAEPHLVVWIDHMEDLAGMISGRARRNLTRVWREGPECGIHLAAAGCRFSKYRSLIPGLASSVHISSAERAADSSSGRAQAVLRMEGKRYRFSPVEFPAREMNTAAALFRAGFRMTGPSLYVRGGSDGSRTIIAAS